METKEFKDFQEFYPFYLSQHRSKINRKFHFIGTTLATLIFIYSIITFNLTTIPFGFLIGYGCAWFGHFFYEKNKPATFRYPLYSLFGDFI